MSKNLRLILILVIGGVIIYLINPTLWGLLAEDTSENTNRAASSFQARIPVSGVIVHPRRIDNKITVTGSIEANEAVEITSEVSGIVEVIHFREGTRVRKGDLLISLDDDELVAQLEKLRYSRKLLQDSEYRQRRLLEKEAISQEEYEIALTELHTVESDIKVLQSQYNKTKIRAPFSGTIGLRYVSQGTYLTPSERIANLYNIDPAKIEFSIPEKYSQKVHVGDEVHFITDALDAPRTGRIYAMEPQVDSQTRTMRLRATSANSDQALLPGQFAKVELIFSSVDQALMVPTEAVIPELGGHKVYISKQGQAEPAAVEVGIRNEREVQVISGLKPLDTVITSGILQIRPGSQIELTLTQ